MQRKIKHKQSIRSKALKQMIKLIVNSIWVNLNVTSLPTALQKSHIQHKPNSKQKQLTKYQIKKRIIMRLKRFIYPLKKKNKKNKKKIKKFKQFKKPAWLIKLRLRRKQQAKWRRRQRVRRLPAPDLLLILCRRVWSNIEARIRHKVSLKADRIRRELALLKKQQDSLIIYSVLGHHHTNSTLRTRHYQRYFGYRLQLPTKLICIYNKKWYQLPKSLELQNKLKYYRIDSNLLSKTFAQERQQEKKKKREKIKEIKKQKILKARAESLRRSRPKNSFLFSTARKDFLSAVSGARKKGIMTQLNQGYFKFLDGVYSSYWLGRFINMFIRRGKKKLVTSHIRRAFVMFKYEFSENPLLFYLETLEKLKPTFRLRKYIVRRTIVKEYPFIARHSRRYMTAVQWIKKEIAHGYTKTAASEDPFYMRVFNKLAAYKINSSKHSLTKTRNNDLKTSIANQHNMRFNWHKKRQ